MLTLALLTCRLLTALLNFNISVNINRLHRWTKKVILLASISCRNRSYVELTLIIYFFA